MTGLLVIASGAVTLAGGGAYLRHARRETRPQVVSWVIWTVLTAVLAVSSLLTGQVPAAVYLLANGAMGAATLAIVIRRGDWTLSLADRACGAGAVIALVLLAAARSPAAATIAAVAADACACGLTLAHAWREPGEEPWTAFAGWAAGGALALAAALAAGQHGVTAVIAPAYLLAADGGTAAVILVRGRRVAGRAADAARVQERRAAVDAVRQADRVQAVLDAYWVPAMARHWHAPGPDPLAPVLAGGWRQAEVAHEELVRPVSSPVPPWPSLSAAERARMADAESWVAEQAGWLCHGHSQPGCPECTRP